MSKNAKFDRAEVVEKATNLYWEKGYHGTSMRDLQATVDLRPGSIYAAFGSKDNLFKEAINHYANSTGKLLQLCLDETSSPLAGLKLFIRKITIENRENAPSDMCMIVKSISELTDNDNKELLDEAKALLNGVESRFADIIEDAMQTGEISSNKNAMDLARYMQVQIIGLRTYSRVNDDQTIIEKFIDDIFVGAPFH
ncbi:TetR/AcrR family transcriptional regulator [Psychromonas algicola]|uniref:TetR/AcrR family transcriptional regulator n=1 Tax=Psychromonas algicola TaxID=2555642 RepID=UPI0010679106|nr:TetR/AcrR family transcriptional regulator [Psychromonas sp. RZ5]TEW52898.1 TetR/AcrR family transcriptional regulator [Psychromonas sp. RZ5]